MWQAICFSAQYISILNVPGIDNKNVYNTVDILCGNAAPVGKTVVIGSGLVGLEVAEYVAEKGNQVTVVEMTDECGRDIGPGRKLNVTMAIQQAGIEQIVNAKCVGIKDNAVTVEINGTLTDISADTIVVAVGSKANDSSDLVAYCTETGIPFHVIGDAKKARRAIDAIHEAVDAAASV